MSLRDDQRGQSMQIGAMLLFAMLVVSMATYQVAVVPNQNANVEFNHNQQVHDQLVEGRDSVLRAAATGGTHPVTVDLGTQFPSRTVFINPPAPSGTLETVQLGNLVVSNAATSGEAGDYWDGSDRSFATAGLSYTPGYSEYQQPPTTVYEHSVLYDRLADGSTVARADQSIIDGRRITLVALDGDVSTTRSGAVSLDFQAGTTSARTVTVTNASTGTPVVVTVPTSLSAAEWDDILADERTGNGGHVVSVDPGATPGTVDIALEAGVTYELRTTEVRIGSGTTEEPARYVTTVGSSNKATELGSPVTLTVEVRDRFNAPVSGESVTFTTTGGSGIYTDDDGNAVGASPVTVTTDGDGRATATFTKREARATVAATLDGASGSDSDPETAVFNLVRSSTDGGDINPTSGLVLTGTAWPNTDVSVTFENRDDYGLTVTKARVNYYHVYEPGSSNPPTSATLDTNPEMTIKGDFVDIADETFDTGVSRTFTMRFYESDGSTFTPKGSNGYGTFMLTLEFSDGTTSSYVIEHQS